MSMDSYRTKSSLAKSRKQHNVRPVQQNTPPSKNGAVERVVQPAETPCSRLSFLRLPVELRNMVYGNLLAIEDSLFNVLRVSRREKTMSQNACNIYMIRLMRLRRADCLLPLALTCRYLYEEMISFAQSHPWKADYIKTNWTTPYDQFLDRREYAIYRFLNFLKVCGTGLKIPPNVNFTLWFPRHADVHFLVPLGCDNDCSTRILSHEGLKTVVSQDKIFGTLTKAQGKTLLGICREPAKYTIRFGTMQSNLEEMHFLAYRLDIHNNEDSKAGVAESET